MASTAGSSIICIIHVFQLFRIQFLIIKSSGLGAGTLIQAEIRKQRVLGCLKLCVQCHNGFHGLLKLRQVAADTPCAVFNVLKSGLQLSQGVLHVSQCIDNIIHAAVNHFSTVLGCLQVRNHGIHLL